MLNLYQSARRAISGIALAALWMGCGMQSPGLLLYYSIRPHSTAEGSLAVSLRIDRFSPGFDTLTFYKCAVNFSAVSCKDGRGRSVSFRESGDCLALDLHDAVPPVTFGYTAAIGDRGRHGHQGGIFKDLVVFDGDHSLMLPTAAMAASDDEIKKKIGRITVACDVPRQWSALVPFPAKRSGRVVTLVECPSYSAVCQLQQSCYAFGRFESHSVRGSPAGLSLAVDPQCTEALPEESRGGILSLYAYYAGLFECEPADLTLLILRKHPADSAHIMGGVGLGAIATTFDPDQPRDWELLSHRFFHVFFDTRVPVSWFRRKPNLWLLEGVATYYENVALGSLPDEIRRSLKIDASENFRSLARRYVYLRIKEPRLAIAPMSEATLRSPAGTEFLHYTQAPLVVKLLEDQGTAKFGGHDRILRFIIDNHKSMTTPQPLFSFAITEDPEGFAGRYLLGSEMLQVGEISRGEEDPAAVVEQLNEFERLIRSWIRVEDPGYNEVDSVSADGLSRVAARAQAESVHFADTAIEMRIEKMSPTVYGLLLKEALQSR